MPTYVAAVTIDCANAIKLAEFWSAVLDRPVDTWGPGANEFFARILPGNDQSKAPMMMFIQVPESKVNTNRVHLDLSADDSEQEVKRLLALGATRVHDKDEWGISWTTLTDPEGNEFCISADQH